MVSVCISINLLDITHRAGLIKRYAPLNLLPSVHLWAESGGSQRSQNRDSTPTWRRWQLHAFAIFPNGEMAGASSDSLS